MLINRITESFHENEVLVAMAFKAASILLFPPIFLMKLNKNEINKAKLYLIKFTPVLISQKSLTSLLA